MHYFTSLRGIAALILVFFHIKYHFEEKIPILSWIINNGYLSVDFFFVLSGFILAYNYESILKNLNLYEFYRFIAKRVARLYPMHFFILLSYTIIPLLLLFTGRSINSDQYGLDSLLAKFLLIDNWWLGYEFSWNVPSWFISAMLPSLFLFPFLINAISRMNIIALKILLVSLSIFLGLLYHLSGANSIGEKIGQLGVIRCGFEFSMGIVIFFIKRHFVGIASIWYRLLCYITFLNFIVFLFLGVKNYFFIPITIALLIISLTGYRGIFHRVLEVRPFLFIGTISYSVYMTHHFIRDIMTLVFLNNNEIAGWSWISVYTILTLIFSIFTYRWIEKPGRLYLIGMLNKRISCWATRRLL